MILVGTPCYSGSVTVQYMRSLFNMTGQLNTAGVHVDIITPSHESLITRGRNFIANEFLRQEEYTHLLFIDSDIGFEAETGLRYLQADKDVVCGIYPTKKIHIDKLRASNPALSLDDAEAASLAYTVKFLPGSKADANGFQQVEYGSTGFMLIKRQVLVRMAEAFPELMYKYSFTTTFDHMFDNFAFFETMIDPETRDYLPEDYAFCKRWRSLGGEVHADIVSRFTHVGSRVYTGNYLVFLQNFAAGEAK